MLLPISETIFPILLLPLIGFFAIFLAGRTASMQRFGDKLATAIMAVVWLMACNAFLGSLQHEDPTWKALPEAQWVMRSWITELPAIDAHESDTLNDWSGLDPQIEKARQPQYSLFSIGLQVDHLTAVMLFVVASVSFFVHLFSIGYMHGEKRYTRFFCILQIFTFAMLLVVMADNYLLLYIGWEIMGFSSYALIGHYYEKKSAQNACMKAFMTTRLGDVLMFVGFMIVWANVGSMRYADVNSAVWAGDALASGLASVGSHAVFPIDWRFWAGLLIFGGAMGKSAQFPLHVWLPDAMEGPTPVSALIHAATMVAAGVYLVARSILIMTPENLLFIAYVGGFTALFSATIAVVQDDIKKVLAYSTISQLGYMMLGLGLAGGLSSHGYSFGTYHLVTHAFFKACLFLGSGSIIHAMHHEQNMSKYGGLWKKLPITFATFLIATLCLCGVPGTSGFFSKDGIIASAIEFGWLGDKTHFLLPFFAVVAAAFTTFYMMRLMFLTFAGEPRDHHAYDHAHESKIMLVPLVYLAAVAMLLAWGGGKWFEERNPMPDIQQYALATPGGATHKAPAHEAPAAPARGHAAATSGAPTQFSALAVAAPETHENSAAEHGGEAQAHGAEAHGAEGHGGAHDPYHTAHGMASKGSYVIVFVFTILAALFYYPKTRIFNPEGMKNAFAPIHALLWNKYYFDELYQRYLVEPSIAICRFVFRFDEQVVDGVVNATGRAGVIAANRVGRFDNQAVDGVVNFVPRSIGGWGGLLARLQTGNIRNYIGGVIGGFCLIVTLFLFFPEQMLFYALGARDILLAIQEGVWSFVIAPLIDFVFMLAGWVTQLLGWVADMLVAIFHFFIYLGQGIAYYIGLLMGVYQQTP